MERIEANALSNRGYPIFLTSKEGVGVHKPNDLKDNHILILHGGADISPALYGKPLSRLGAGDHSPSRRDQHEWDLIKAAIERDIPIVGICRGAQMLCAYDGGHLVQHIERHAGDGHLIKDVNTEETVYSNSCHHQMMVPSKHAEVIAYCNKATMGYDENDDPFAVDRVPEVVYFPNIRALGIQGHPEWMHGDTPFVQYCSKLIASLLLRN
jgi:putative glutamine amidotransferase